MWGTLRVKCGESRKQLICYLAVLLRAIVLTSPLTLGYAISDDRSLVRCAHTTIRPSSAFGFGFRLQPRFQLLPCPRLRLALFLATIRSGLLLKGMAAFAPWLPWLHHLYSLPTCLHLPAFNNLQFMGPPNLTDDRQPLVSMLGHHHACLTCMQRLWSHGHGFQIQKCRSSLKIMAIVPWRKLLPF